MTCQNRQNRWRNCSIFADNTTAYTPGNNIATTNGSLSRDITAAASWCLGYAVWCRKKVNIVGATVLKFAWLLLHHRQLFHRHHHMHLQGSVHRCCHDHDCRHQHLQLPTLGSSPMLVSQLHYRRPRRVPCLRHPRSVSRLLRQSRPRRWRRQHPTRCQHLGLRCRLPEICLHIGRGLAVQLPEEAHSAKHCLLFSSPPLSHPLL